MSDWLDKLAADQPTTEIPKGYYKLTHISKRLRLSETNTRKMLLKRKAKRIKVKIGKVIAYVYSM